MEKETIFIAISNQKGGVGKSTLTTLIASYLHYGTEKKAAVIDCDFPQHSVFRMRSSDIETVNSSRELQAALQKQFEATGKKAYRIINATPEKALEQAQALSAPEKGKPDIILFDLPGTVDSTGVLRIIFNMDYIFVPVTADKRVLQSSLAFIMSVDRYKKALHSPVRLREVFIFWNRVDRRERTGLYDFFDRLAQAENYRILDTRLPDMKRYNRELSPAGSAVFRSTLFPPDRKLLKGSNLRELAGEICSIIHL